MRVSVRYTYTWSVELESARKPRRTFVQPVHAVEKCWADANALKEGSFHKVVTLISASVQVEGCLPH